MKLLSVFFMLNIFYLGVSCAKDVVQEKTAVKQIEKKSELQVVRDSTGDEDVVVKTQKLGLTEDECINSFNKNDENLIKKCKEQRCEANKNNEQDNFCKLL